MTYALIWLAVTATAVFVAAAAVGSVRNQVTDAPTVMAPTTTIIAGAPTITAPPPAADTTTTTAPTTATTTANTTTTAEPTTTAPTVTTTSPAEPRPTTTTTTTTTPPSNQIRSYDLVGGSVTVEIGASAAVLAGASPKAGFNMEVEHDGPEKVEVEFKSTDHESKFSGEFKDGRFVPEIEESDRDEESDDHDDE